MIEGHSIECVILNTIYAIVWLHLGFFFIDMGNSSMPISQWEFVDYWLNFSGAFLIGFAFYIVGYMVKIIK